MSMNLDARQRAMLLEMGVRVWQPQAPLQPQAPDDAPPPAPQAVTVSGQVQAAPLSAPVTAPHLTNPVSSSVAGSDWGGLQTAVSACQACGLCQSRRHTVFGAGVAPARWLIVGEAPGEQEDLQGQPFVGPAGQLLDNMLKAVGLSRGGDVFITNVLKCRPPANRNPQPEEMAQCSPFLQRQI
jgi:DNA polymerase